jgi:hypothetical protein
MGYPSYQLSSASTHFNLIAICIVALLFTSQSTASDIVTDDAIEFQIAECWVQPYSKAMADRAGGLGKPYCARIKVACCNL